MKTLAGKLLLCGLLSAVWPAAASPQAKPLEMGEFDLSVPAGQKAKGDPFADTKLVVFKFDANMTYPVLTREGMQTVIELGEGETAMGFYLSDTQNWEFHVAGDKRHILVKPTLPELFNSATLITSKRTYLLAMTSNSQGRWYQRVKWRSVDDQARSRQGYLDEFVQREGGVEAVPAKDGGQPNFEYDIEGSADFRPISVYDNGKFTWFVLPKDVQELPALFSLSQDNEVEVVNYAIQGNALVVNRRIHGAVLKLGDREVKVYNRASRPRKKTLFGFGWGE